MSNKKNYYDKEEEDAVMAYINSNSEEERNRIYREKLSHVMDKMIKSIIRTYKLYIPRLSFKDIHHETLAHLITKVEKFDPDKHKKSYSYYSAIVKNYLINEIKKAKKNQKTNIPYEDISKTVEDSPDMIYEIDEYEIDHDEFISKLISQLEEQIENFKEKSSETKNYNNEIQVGQALVTILSDWNTLFSEQIDNKKFNKELILMYLRNITGFTTKEIRKYMKKYKAVYYAFKLDYLDE